MGKVTNEMMRAGSKAYLDEAMQVSHQATCDWGGLLAAYLAMREARPRKTRPVAAEKPVVDRDAVAKAIRQAYYTKANSILSVDWAVLADAAIAAMGAEPSEELAALRARCERLAAVVRNVAVAFAPYDLHTLYSSQTPRITTAEASHIGDALDALHPGDTEEAK